MLYTPQPPHIKTCVCFKRKQNWLSLVFSWLEVKEYLHEMSLKIHIKINLQESVIFLRLTSVAGISVNLLFFFFFNFHRIMLYGKYIPGGKLNYVMLEWETRAMHSFWVSLSTALEEAWQRHSCWFVWDGEERCVWAAAQACAATWSMTERTLVRNHVKLNFWLWLLSGDPLFGLRIEWSWVPACGRNHGAA